MGYTLEQLEAMGATPVTQSRAAPPPNPTGTKKYTLQELQAMGARPVTQTQEPPQEPPKRTFMEKAGGVLDAVFGGGKVGEAIGTYMAKNSPEGQYLAQQERMGIAPKGSVEETFKGPTGSQIAGSAAQSALTFAPVGRLATGIGTVGKLAGLGKAAGVVGNVGAGATTGYGFDVASGFAQGEENPFEAGMGTVVGGAIPLVGPAIRGTGRVAGEALGVSTGTGYGAVKRGYEATSAGGASADAFRSAMRGNVSPEQIVDEARNALGQIVVNRRKAYQGDLANLKTNVHEYSPASLRPLVDSFQKQMNDFGVVFDEAGVPNFERSPGLGRYEGDLTKIGTVLQNWGSRPGDMTVVGIDKLKQVLDDFRIGSRDSQKFDSFVTNLRNKAKDIIKNEPGYEKMVKDYESSTGLIKEIQRGLSLGDRAQADTAFRKLTGALRVNNEFRRQLINELDTLTDGTLSAKIAGQQMSEMLPRGLIRPIGGLAGAAGVLGGVGIIPLLKAALFTSPRIVGEILSALGYSAKKIQQIMKLIAPQGVKFPGDAVLDMVGGPRPPYSSSMDAIAPIATNMAKTEMKAGTPIAMRKGTSTNAPTKPAVPATTILDDVDSISKTVPRAESKSITTSKKGLNKPEKFPRAATLNLSDRRVEGRAFKKIKEQGDKILAEYKQKRGKVINTDEFRPFFTDVGYNGSNSAAVQEPSSYLAKKAYTDALKNPEPFVTLQAGGSGTGKTKSVKRLRTVSREMKNSAAILDSNLSGYNSAIKKIKEAEDAGKIVKINFIYRDPLDSLENGVVKRMLENKSEMGRVVPVKVIAENHIDSFDVVRRLQDEGYVVRYIDNSLGHKKSRVTTRKQLESKVGNRSKAQLEKLFISKIKQLEKNGIITKEQLKGYLQQG